jgi:hypothetical protein
MKKLTVNADKFAFLRNVKAIVKKSQAVYNSLMVTTNYDLFKMRDGNRDGIQSKRVKSFLKKIDANRFYPILGAIFVDKNFVIVDGHHRFEALKLRGKAVVFMVVENYDLNEIADYNSSMSSSWKNDDNFSSALYDKAELAVVLAELKAELVEKYGLTDQKINVGDMYGILTENIKYFGSGVNTVTRDMYFNKELADKARTIGYQSTLDIYASLKRRWIDSDKAYKAVKVVMECTFKGNKKATNFSLDTFYKNLQTTSFNMKFNDVYLFTHEAVNVHNLGLTKEDKAILLVA